MNIRRLVTADEAQILSFLNCKPLENIIPIGFLQANGLENPDNRGVFYGHFEDGCLTGVMLVTGKVAMLHGSRDSATAFGAVASDNHGTELRQVLGKEAIVKAFDDSFNRGELRREPTEHLFWVNRFQEEVNEQSGAERFQELSAAEVMKSISTGSEYAGLAESVRGRAALGRVMVARDTEGIAFKADVVSESEDGVYLESVWTRPDLRTNGFAKSAMKSLCRVLLNKYHAVCLFADTQNKRAMAFYRDAGFEPLSRFCLLKYHPVTE